MSMSITRPRAIAAVTSKRSQFAELCILHYYHAWTYVSLYFVFFRAIHTLFNMGVSRTHNISSINQQSKDCGLDVKYASYDYYGRWPWAYSISNAKA
eukprot:6213608-Pleurochrysis_carterae.AAC.1